MASDLETEAAWASIRYRELHDIPRLFIAEHENVNYFFKCAFDDRLDDYSDHFEVLRLDQYLLKKIDDSDWSDIRGDSIAQIAVRDVVFDASKRRAISTETFKQLKSAE